MPATIYPGADQSRRYDGAYPGVVQSGVDKLVLHSTETTSRWGCPGYNGGGSAPTLTVDPWAKKVWQHFPATVSARALLNPDSTPVSENRDNVAQIEIIGYSYQPYGVKYGSNLRELPDDGYDFLARVVAWFSTEYGVPLTRPEQWPPYPSSYGNTSARMTSAQYDSYKGVLGHLHVSGNSHGDPTIDIDKLLTKAKELTSTGAAAATVVVTKAAIARFQRAIGVEDSGTWDPETDRQALALRNYLASGRTPSKWDRKRGWHHVYGKGGKGSAKAARRSIQWALGVDTDSIWGPNTEAAFAAFREAARS